MIETVANELWSELKRYVNTVDRAEAAVTVVSVLIDHDCDAEDIRDAFKGDSDIKRALTDLTTTKTMLTMKMLKKTKTLMTSKTKTGKTDVVQSRSCRSWCYS